MDDRRAGRWIAWLAGGLCALGLLAAAVARTFPYLPRPLELRVTFPAGVAGESEPLLATGRYERADFLNVEYVDAATAVFRYDAWGPGGPRSAPFALRPGTMRTLKIETPGLDYGGAVKKREQRPLRVWLDGEEMLNAPVFFYARTPEQVFFGCNPIGGNNEGVLFRGTLARPDGRAVGGGPETFFPLHERFGAWITTRAWELLPILLAGALVGLAARPLLRLAGRGAATLRDSATFKGHAHSPHRAFGVTALACALIFSALITQGTFKLVFEESFGNFYDHQAASLLQGRLDVPREALGGEAFIIGGKTYGYFGITPALLRVPFVALDVGFGRLSRVFMLLYFVACLAAGHALLCAATRRIVGPAAWPSRWAVVVFTSCTGLGSTLLFLGTRAYIYHEAILCGAAFALWGVWFVLRWLAAPSGRGWIGALACGVAAVHARPPAGLFALAVLGCAALWTMWRIPEQRKRALVVAALAALGFASFNVLSWLKFRTLDGMPLRYSVQYTPERRARFGDQNVHFGNLRHNVDTYLLGADFHLEARFPFFFFGTEKLRYYPNARIDMEEPALALPFAMPALFLLAALGGAWAFVRAPALRAPLALVVLGAQPMAVALSTAIVTSHRYTGDFCAFLIACAAAGLAVIDAQPARSRRPLLTAFATLTGVSAAITLALALHFQTEIVWGIADEGKANLEAFRRRIDTWVDAPRR